MSRQTRLAWLGVPNFLDVAPSIFFEATGSMGGHTLKHLVAALAAWVALRHLRLRRHMSVMRTTRETL